MKVRINVILEFSDETTQEEYEEAMTNIYDKMWDNCIDVDVLGEEEV